MCVSLCKHLGISLDKTEKFDSDTFEAAFYEFLVNPKLN